ncbi:cell division GTPase FtsZ [Thermococcus stetteri]|nr:cell division GTPase FtsZ [Thermococcus stetteri]
MFSRLYYYLESQMLVNIDYADLFNMIRGGNVGILRLLREVDFTWHWGIWERGLIGILVRNDFPLKGAHSILHSFQEILSEKDVIWGVITDENLNGRVEILSLLVKKW